MRSQTMLDRSSVGTALTLILVGGPLVIIDFTIGRSGGQEIDILNDAIGFGLILWAVSLLARQPGPEIYAPRMRLVRAVTAVLLGWSVVVQIAPEIGASILGIVFSGISTLGMILFCTSMRDLSTFHGFPRSSDNWRRAAKLVLILYGIGWIISFVLYLGRAFSQGALTPTTVTFDASGPAVLLLLLVLGALLIPLVFVLIAIVALKTELRD